MNKKPNSADAGKDARLAAALRENLKRRKAQARARAEKSAPERHDGRESELGQKRD